MPKGRHLKPDFFTDKNIVAMQPLARLLYEGLWCYAADCGHLDDEPVELKIRILPADPCDVDALLDEIAWHGRIERKDGVIFLPKLGDHARVDKRYETKCDACKHAVTTPGEPPPQTPNTSSPQSDHDGDTTGAQRDHDADGDGDGDGDVMVKGARKKPSVRLPSDWSPTDEHRKRCSSQGIDIENQLARFRAHAEANDRRQVNWNAAFTQWLLGVPTWQRGGAPTPATVDDESLLPPVEDSWMRRRPRR